MRRNYKKIKIIVYISLLLIFIIIYIIINSGSKEFYNNKKHGFSVAVTNNWIYLSDSQMNKYYKNSGFYSSTQDFSIIFTALKYNEKYSVKNNIPNPNIIILYSERCYDPKELVNSLSSEVVKTGSFKYDGGNETSSIGSLKWQSSYISSQTNSLIVLQDYYATVYNNKTYLIIATSFSNENLGEIYDLLSNITFHK